jgi:transposase InsO family protein
MAENAHIFPIKKMSEVLSVSRSGYYGWLNRPPSKRARQNQRLREAIRSVWLNSKQRYGSPRIHRQLLAQGWNVSRQRIARLMRAMGMASCIRRKWVKTTDSAHRWPVAPHLLNRQFNPARLGQAWVSDITFIPTRQGWQYLTAVIDLADRQVIGWSYSKTMEAKQTSIAALKQALQKRPPSDDGLIFHSDQGSQYACNDFTNLLATYNITQSMSRKGNCWDNAPAESFFKTLKYELDMPESYEHYRQARSAIFEFIEIWYNRKRLHSALNYLSPAQAEQQLKQKQAA